MSKKLLIIIVVVFVVLLGLMGTGFFFMWSKLNSVNAQVVNSEEGEQEQSAEAPAFGPIHPLDTFIVNLADEGGSRYLRITMKLELDDEKTAEIVQRRLPLIRDSVLMVIPSKKYEDVHTVEGKNALRDEIVTKLNGFMMPGKITNIYFTEFVVQ